jgi:hypothetical protein
LFFLGLMRKPMSNLSTAENRKVNKRGKVLVHIQPVSGNADKNVSNILRQEQHSTEQVTNLTKSFSHY